MRRSGHIALILFTLLITFASCATRKKANDKLDKFNGSANPDSLPGTDSLPSAIDTLPDDTLALTLPGDTVPGDSAAPKKFLEAKVDYKCMDSIVFDVKSKMMYLYDSSRIDYTTLTIEAYYLTIDMDKQQLMARGEYDSIMERPYQPPYFQDGDQFFEAMAMDYNFKSKKGLIQEAFTSEGETYLHARLAKKDSNDVVYVKDAKFTTCSDPVPHYHIAATKAKIIPKDIVVTGPANLQIQNVPTPLVLPFGFFPIKEERTSGILLPEYGELDNYGFFLRNFGYYFAISKKIDLSLYADIYSSLSFGARARLNYKVRYKFGGSVDLGFNNMQYGDPQVPSDFRRDREFKFSWQHIQDAKANPNAGFQASVNVQTGNYNKYNTTDVSGLVQNIFKSNIQYTRRFANTPLSLSLGVSHDQNTQNRALNITLPNFNFFVTRLNPFKRKVQVGEPRWYESIALNYTLSIRADLNTLDTLFVRYFTSSAKRISPGMKQEAALSANFKAFQYMTLTPSISYRELWNFRNMNIAYDPVSQTNVTDTLFGFFTGRDVRAALSINTSPLYGYYYMKKGNLIGVQHMMTPNLTFSYQPDLGDRVTGFYGTNGELISWSPNQIGVWGAPASGESGLVDFSLINRLEMKVKSRKDTVTGTRKIPIFDQLVFNIGYNFALDSLNLQPFTIRGNTNLFNSMLQMQFGFSFDPYAVGYSNGLAVRINQFEYSQTKKLLRFTNAFLNLNFTYRGQTKRNKEVEQGLDEVEQMLLRNQAYNFVDFNIPYSFTIAYNIQYAKPLDKSSLVHTINLAGDFNITQKWKVRFNLNYDFINNKITTSSIDIYRDLHCWEMRFTVIPFGVTKQYSFTINVKSPLLQALKLNRRRGYVNF